MRRAAAIDKNQPAIVEALRQCGAHVTITSQLKNAFDLIVVYKGTVYICEVKDGTLNPSARKLTEGELECKTSIERAGGTYHVITSINDALKMIGYNVFGLCVAKIAGNGQLNCVSMQF
jgi:hypothetical protein